MVEVLVEELSSPKFHDQLLILPVEVSVKFANSAVALAVNPATGGGTATGGGASTVIVFVFVAVFPVESVTARVTEYVPALPYEIVGIFAVLEGIEAPLPKLQLQLLMVAVEGVRVGWKVTN